MTAEVILLADRRNVDGTVRQARQRQVHGHVPPAMRDKIEAMNEPMRLAVHLSIP